MPTLTLRRAGHELLVLPLTSERRIFGRGEDCDHQLADPAASRKHFTLQQRGLAAVLTNHAEQGTEVAGVNVVTEALLDDGDVIRVGELELLFTSELRVELSQAITQPQRAPETHDLGRSANLRSLGPLQLRFVREGERDVVRPWTKETMTLGKAHENDLAIDDPSVSSRHARLFRTGGIPVLEDLGSLNGTYVNGIAVYRVPLLPGAKISLGEAQLILERVGTKASTSVLPGVIGESEAMREVLHTVQKLVAARVSVALTGESGTGKSALARAIHEAGPRRGKKFVTINCATLDANLIGSELFGHEKAAFTGATHERTGAFEEADGGTLFLDEIGDLSVDLQARLFVVLQDRVVKPVGSNRSIPVDVRVITATSLDVPELVTQKRFREELWNRLNTIELELPPLRARGDDLWLLVEALLAELTPPGQSVQLSGSAREALAAHLFPGNVRELRNAMERAMVLRSGEVIEAGDLRLRKPEGAAAGSSGPSLTLQPHQSYPDYMRELCIWYLAQHGGKLEPAAKALGISRGTFRRYLPPKKK